MAESEARYRGLLEAAPDAMVVVDLAGQIVLLNVQAERQFGYRRDELLGQAVTNIIPAGFAERLIADDLRSDADALAQRIGTGLELVARRKDGSEFPIELMLSPLENAGEVLITAAIRDISVRRASEVAMRRSDERFRRLFDSNTIGITVSELSGRVLEANDAFLAMIAYTRAEFATEALDWEAVTAPEYLVSNLRARGELRATGVTRPWEKEYVRRDGRRVPVLIGMAMLEAPEPTCISYIVDLSARRDLESQLRHAQKMEAIGQLAGGIAHDFNNLLTVILGHTELALHELTAGDPLLGSMEEVRDASTRAVAMTRQLLAFSRRQVLEPRTLDLNLLIQKLEKLLRRLIGEDIELLVTLRPDASLIVADAGQIEQVLMNLVVNARDAMPEGGSLAIVLGELEVPEPSEQSTAAVLPPGAYITVTVIDTGTGMSALTKTHLFEPFYTTKRAEKGTGLGLATAYGIIKQSGGDIHVVSELGQGSAFVLHLPRSDEAPEAAPAPASVAVDAEARATETLLLVEDDPAVRRLTRRMLEARGYRVLEAIDAESALVTAASYHGSIDLLLTDVVMPGMSGIELAARLGEERPDTRVVFMSGYTDDRVSVRALARRPSFLPKPFTSDALALKLREARA